MPPGIYIIYVQKTVIPIDDDDDVQTEGVAARDETKSLAEFCLSTLAMTAEMKSDNTVRAAAKIKSCTLFDRRHGKEAGITQYVIICPMHEQHWTDYKISLCVCELVSE